MNYLKKIALYGLSLALLNPPLWCMEETTITKGNLDCKQIEGLSASIPYLNNLFLFMYGIKGLDEKYQLNVDVKRSIARLLASLTFIDFLDTKISKTVKIHSSSICSGEISPNSEIALTLSWDGEAHLWDARTGELIKKLTAPFSSIKGGFNLDSKTVFTLSHDKETCFYDAKTGHYQTGGHQTKELINHLEKLSKHTYTNLKPTKKSSKENLDFTKKVIEYGNGIDMILCNTGSSFALTVSKDTAYLWDVETEKLIKELKHPSNILSAKFNYNYTIALTLSGETLYLWDTKTGQLIKQLKADNAETKELIKQFKEQKGHNWLLVMSPDGKTCFTGLKDGTIHWLNDHRCEATNLILNETSHFELWLINKAHKAKKAHSKFKIVENTAEHTIFKKMSETMQNYLKKSYSVEIVSKDGSILE